MMAANRANGNPNKKRIKSALLGAGLQTVENDVLSKCVALASTLHLTPETMAEVWEAYSLNKQNLTELTMLQFEGFKNELIQASSKTPATPDVPKSGAIMVSQKPVKREASLVTPMSGAKRQKQQQNEAGLSSVDRVVSSAVPSPVRSSAPLTRNLPKYQERTKVGQVVASYGKKPLASESFTSKPLVSTTSVNETSFGDVTSNNINQSYRFMFTTMEDRAKALEAHLVKMKERLAQEHHAPLEEVNVPRQDPTTCIGRICNEAHSGKLNATSVVLEGSSASCGGARVNVDLSHVVPESQPQGYSLFPGQIVAVEGMNGTGRRITATKVKEGAPLAPMASKAKAIKNLYNTSKGPIKVMSACGPFTTSSNMEYEPFVDLMHVIMEEKPSVVILMGPFVDLRHEQVKSGRPSIDAGEGPPMVVDYETVFAQNISGLLEEFFESENASETEFVLVPALEDATAKCVYPQPPLEDRLPKGGTILNNIPGADGIEFGSAGLYRLTKPQANGKSKVHCLPNPCTFSINEVVFGVTSTDVLFHMSIEETNANLPVGSRMRRISQHMLQQQSYYPLFPPNRSVNLDLKQQDGWTMSCRPDVLVLPSKLTPFCAPILNSTIAVNPGHLSKGTTGGTYAIMEIMPMEDAKLDQDEEAMIPHDIHERMHLEIKRI